MPSVNVGPLICDECSELISGKGHLFRHISSIHGESAVVCDVCSKEFTTNSILVQHIRVQHQHRAPTFKCHDCPRQFRSRGALRQHTLVIHVGAKVQCDVCDKLFGRKPDVIMHIISVHQQNRPYKCSLCHAAFTHPIRLHSHKVNTHDRTEVQCDVCDAMFGQRSNVLKHNRPVHLQLHPSPHLKRHTVLPCDRKVRECDDCGALFGNNSKMYRHIRMVHWKLEPFDCVQCQRKFSDEGNLTRHIRSIHKRTVFTCDVCNKVVKAKRTIASHCFAAHLSW